MNEGNTKVIAGLYPRVSTEDQSRFGHSLDEQEDRLKKLCEFKGYEIYKVYREKVFQQRIPIVQNLKK